MKIISNMRKTLELGTDFWNDSCSLTELSHAVSEGAVGSTSNPVIVSTVVDQEKETWIPILDDLIHTNPNDTEDDLAWKLVSAMGTKAASLLEPVYSKTKGQKGYLSVQTNPKFFCNTKRIVEQGQIFSKLAPNIAVKVPAVEAGIRAIEELVAKGISINATVSYSVPQALTVAQAVERNMKKDIPTYVTLMIGRLDDRLRKEAERDGMSVNPDHLHWAGIAVFKKAYKIFQERNYRATLLAAAYRNQMHWSELVGAKAVLTMPYAWWTKFNLAKMNVTSRIDLPVSDEIMSTLRQFRTFNQAYEENGMNVSDFVTFGPTVDTLHQFLEGYQKLLSVVRNRMLRS